MHIPIAIQVCANSEPQAYARVCKYLKAGPDWHSTLFVIRQTAYADYRGREAYLDTLLNQFYEWQKKDIQEYGTSSEQGAYCDSCIYHKALDSRGRFVYIFIMDRHY